MQKQKCFPCISSFQILNLQKIFSASYLFSSSTTPMTRILGHLLLCCKTLILYSFFIHIFASLLLNVGNFLFSNLLISLVISNLLLRPLTEFFIVVIVFFSCKISIWYYIMYSIFLLRFSISALF